MILDAAKVDKVRRATAPSKSSQRKRTDKKVMRGQTKKLRGKVNV